MSLSPASADPFGPTLHADGVTFRAWAPRARRMQVVLHPGSAAEQSVEMWPIGDGFFAAEVPGARAGCRYLLQRDREPPQPDPASPSQPDGVWGPSEVIDHAFDWSDAAWRGVPAADAVLYELHVGAFSASGTYDGVRERLDHLVALGVDTLKLMPIATCPGTRNWGYDGVFHLAPFARYGRPEQLRQLVDACHARGLAVLVDLVTNHFGPEGNAMWTLCRDFFGQRDTTPWGPGPRFESEAVLAYFAQVARSLRRDYHVDGLRIDAFQTIPEAHRHAHLETMIAAFEEALPAGAHATVMLESTDDARAHLRHREGGVSVTQLCFDVQRAAHRLLTGETHGVYEAYHDPAQHLVRCARHGFTRTLGSSPPAPVAWATVVNSLQNHDSPGSRYRGQRLEALIDARRWRAAQAWLLLQPGVPYLWMGSEWGSRTPWLFFTDFSEALGRRVAQSRLLAFDDVDLSIDAEPAPDPQDPEALHRSTLDWSDLERTEATRRLSYIRELIALRRRVRPDMTPSTEGIEAQAEGAVLKLRIAGRTEADGFVLWANLGDTPVPLPEGLEELFTSDPLDAAGSLGPDTTVLCRR